MMAPKCLETANRLDALQSGGVIWIKIVAGHKGQMLIRQMTGTIRKCSSLTRVSSYSQFESYVKNAVVVQHNVK